MVETTIEQHISLFALCPPPANVSSLSLPILVQIPRWGVGFKAVAYLDFIAKSYFPKFWYVDHDYMSHFGCF